MLSPHRVVCIVVLLVAIEGMDMANYSNDQIGHALASNICNDLGQRRGVFNSFYAFVQSLWDTIIPEDPVWNWHIKVICDEVQTVLERVILGLPKAYDLLINVPPGSTKSTICSVMAPAWLWVRMGRARVICGSYSKELALDLARKGRDVVNSEPYQTLTGGIALKEDQNTKGHFVNQYQGGRFSTSTGGAVTGFHAHAIFVDDPLNPKKAASDLELANANKWIGQTLSTRKIDKAITPTIMIMQRLHEDDPAARMIEAGEKGTQRVRHINLPAEIDDSNRRDVKPRALLRYYVEDPECPGARLLDAERMARMVLDEFKADNQLGEYGYAGQMQQRPTPLGGGLFKVERLKIDECPADHRWRQRVRFWDKAGTEGGGAFTVGVLMGEDIDGRFWVIDVIRVQVDTAAREALIELTRKLDGPDVMIGVEQEPGSGGKESAEGTIKNLAGSIAEAVRPTGSKTLRAVPFSSQVNAHNVSLVEAEWNKEYVKEHGFFPVSKYKDQVDASSGAFTMLTVGRGRIGAL